MLFVHGGFAVSAMVSFKQNMGLLVVGRGNDHEADADRSEEKSSDAVIRRKPDSAKRSNVPSRTLSTADAFISRNIYQFGHLKALRFYLFSF